jgi:hypothetical protein
MSVSCELCVLSSRGLCVGLITRPQEPYRMCGVSECDCEASNMRRPWPTTGCRAMKKKIPPGTDHPGLCLHRTCAVTHSHFRG